MSGQGPDARQGDAGSEDTSSKVHAGVKRKRDDETELKADAAEAPASLRVRFNDQVTSHSHSDGVAAAVDGDSDGDVGPQVPQAVIAALADDSDDDVGPKVPGEFVSRDAEPPRLTAKRKRVLPMEKTFLAALPSASMYEKSYMHRDMITHNLTTPRADFFITGSADGVLKFWKKTPTGLEFVKTYRGHVGPITGLSVSDDGLRLCSVGDDCTLKVYDVLNFDMVDMIRLPFQPAAATWIYRRGSATPLLAVSDRHDPAIHIYNADLMGASAKREEAVDEETVVGAPQPALPSVAAAVAASGKSRIATPLATLRIHTASVLVLAYNPTFDSVISADAKGVIEVWSADATTGFGSPPPGTLKYTYKSETDLYDIAKMKAFPQSIAVSHSGRMFATTSTDRRIRVFRFRTGKLARAYSEAIEVYDTGAAAGAPDVDPAEFAKRLALEKETSAATIAAIKAFISPPLHSLSAQQPMKAEVVYRPPPSNAVFDETDNFIIYPSMLGIKVVNLVTNKVSALLGRVEGTERFLGIALYQGVPKTSSQFSFSTAPAPALLMSSTESQVQLADPTIITGAYRRNRFYLFTRREPADLTAIGTKEGRDVFNEPPSKEDLAVASEATAAIHKAKLGNEAVIHTTMGDLFFKLMPDIAPKAVENFCGHSRTGYYNSLIFHRIIKDFMIQTGDPKGDGTGGSSIWGHDFEDEIDKSARFDRPGILAMANCGAGTNGSQFFVTTAACPWLDGKHTIFGRLARGLDVVKGIESVGTHPKTDRPYDDIKIINIDIK